MPDPHWILRTSSTEPKPGYTLRDRDIAAPTDDRAAALESGTMVGISAWDRELTTVAQAKELTEKEHAYKALAGTCRRLGVEHEVPVDVVYTPASEPSRPGAAGHCDIRGLAAAANDAGPDTAPGQRKRLRKALAARFIPAED